MVISLNATAGLDVTIDLQEQSLEETDYVGDDADGMGADEYEGGDVAAEEYTHEDYADTYGADGSELPEDQLEYGEEQATEQAYQDEVLDLEISEPLDDEFQVSSAFCGSSGGAGGDTHHPQCWSIINLYQFIHLLSDRVAVDGLFAGRWCRSTRS